MSRFGSVAAEHLALCKRIALWPARVAAARAVMTQLAAMNVRELADIGLSPQDVRDATALPLSEDPTGILAVRVAEAKLRAAACGGITAEKARVSRMGQDRLLSRSRRENGRLVRRPTAGP